MGRNEKQSTVEFRTFVVPRSFCRGYIERQPIPRTCATVLVTLSTEPVSLHHIVVQQQTCFGKNASLIRDSNASTSQFLLLITSMSQASRIVKYTSADWSQPHEWSTNALRTHRKPPSKRPEWWLHTKMYLNSPVGVRFRYSKVKLETINRWKEKKNRSPRFFEENSSCAVRTNYERAKVFNLANFAYEAIAANKLK